MSDKIELIATIVPKNDAGFPIAFSKNVQYSDGTVEGALDTLNTNIGSLDNLETSSKGSIVDAINAVQEAADSIHVKTLFGTSLEGTEDVNTLNGQIGKSGSNFVVSEAVTDTVDGTAVGIEDSSKKIVSFNSESVSGFAKLSNSSNELAGSFFIEGSEQSPSEYIYGKIEDMTDVASSEYGMIMTEDSSLVQTVKFIYRIGEDQKKAVNLPTVASEKQTVALTSHADGSSDLPAENVSVTGSWSFPTTGLTVGSTSLTEQELTNFKTQASDVPEIKSSLEDHLADHENPHQVTKAQVGLGNVDNTSDINKPISTAQSQKFNELSQSISDNSDTITNHIANKSNPHEVTKDQVGLGNVTNAGMDSSPIDKSTNYVTSGGVKTYVDNSVSGVSSTITDHIADKDNPHAVTKDQVGLGSVVNATMDPAPSQDSTNYVTSGGVKTYVDSTVGTVSSELSSHEADYSNPHKVTKGQVGLGNVDNTSDADKPISTAQSQKFDELNESISENATSISDHVGNTSNPHNVTKDQVGLGSVVNATMDSAPTESSQNYVTSGGVKTYVDGQVSTVSQSVTTLQGYFENGIAKKATADANGNDISTTYVKNTMIGATSGVASLDDTGKIPASQLPSYVDDVLEYDSVSDFPESGEAGKIYVSKENNLTYRWTGTGYAEISQSLALGSTSSTAWAGDKGLQNQNDIATLQGYFTGDAANKAIADSNGTPFTEYMSDINAKYTKPSDGIPMSDLASSVSSLINGAVQTSTVASGTVKGAVLLGVAGGAATYEQANSKYTKPSTGIPKTDLASDVQTSLGKADSALQSLPIASQSSLGGIKVGAGLAIGEDGTLSATGGGTADAVAWENVTSKPFSSVSSTDFSTASGTLSLTKNGLVTSVAGKSGAVTLAKGDVGLGNVVNVGTDSTPTSGSSNNITSGAVYTALSGKQDSLSFDGTYNASINKAATVSTVTNATSSLVPNSRTINGKALTGNITLSASDVGALPNSTVIFKEGQTFSIDW